jgi:hypothetical protein
LHIRNRKQESRHSEHSRSNALDRRQATLPASTLIRRIGSAGKERDRSDEHARSGERGNAEMLTPVAGALIPQVIDVSVISSALRAASSGSRETASGGSRETASGGSRETED